MEKIVSIFKRNWIYLVGALVGAVGGYLYWYYVGCESGTCPITASPTNTMIYGALVGSLLFGMFKKQKKDEKTEE